jgi:hypothetical protein
LAWVVLIERIYAFHDSQNSIVRLVSRMETHCVFYAVGTEFVSYLKNFRLM